MDEKIFLFYMAVFVCITAFLTGFFLQDISRKGIFFGVRIPDGYQQKPEFKSLKARYRINYGTSFGIYCTLYLFLCCNNLNLTIFIMGALFSTVVVYINYLYIHVKAKNIKLYEGSSIVKRDIVVVDTGFRDSRKKRVQIPAWWFCIPAAAVLFNIVVSILQYDMLPPMIAVHWGASGMADAWAVKSYTDILSIPVILLFVLLFVFFKYRISGKVKQQIDPDDTDESTARSRAFRYVWSVYFLVISILLSAIFTILQLNKLMIIRMGPEMLVIIICISLLTAIAGIAISVLVGQGGSRIRINGKGRESMTIDRNDDKLWKLGFFYYNPDDPSVFIEKRVGVGWGLNYARPAAIIIAVIAVLLVIGSVGMAVLPSLTK